MVMLSCVVAWMANQPGDDLYGTMGIFALFSTGSNDIALGLPGLWN